MSVTELENALQLDPRSFIAWTWLGVLLASQDEHERTLAAGRRPLELDQTAWGAYVAIGATYRNRRQFQQAISAYRKGVKVSSGFPYMITNLGLALGLNGNIAEARSLLERRHAMKRERYVPKRPIVFPIWTGITDASI